MKYLFSRISHIEWGEIKTRWRYMAVCVFMFGVMCFPLFILSGCDTDEIENRNVEVEDTSATIEIEDFSQSEYSLEIGETQNISLSLSPKNLDISDVIISTSDSNVISISEEKMKTGWLSQNSELSFTVTASSEGSAILCVSSSDGTVKSNEVTFSVKKPVKIESFGTFKQSQMTVYIDDTIDIAWNIYPKESKELLREDIELKITDEAVISIKETSFAEDGKVKRLSFTVTGLAEGRASITLQSVDGTIVSEPLEIDVTVAPIVKSFGKFNQSSFHMEVGDTYKLTQHILPAGLSRDDIIVELSDDKVISITENAFEDEDDKTVFVYTITGLSPGESKVILKGADEKTSADVLTFYITEKDTSRTVYITPTGKRYHFSAACAGDNATSITLNQATGLGYTPCKKCAH